MVSYRAAEEFLSQQSKENPERWKEVSERYPVISDYKRNQIYHDPVDGLIDESPSRRRKRNRTRHQPDYDKPKTKRLSQDDWAEYRKAKKRYLEDYYDEVHYARELADQGM